MRANVVQLAVREGHRGVDVRIEFRQIDSCLIVIVILFEAEELFRYEVSFLLHLTMKCPVAASESSFRISVTYVL